MQKNKKDTLNFENKTTPQIVRPFDKYDHHFNILLSHICLGF